VTCLQLVSFLPSPVTHPKMLSGVVFPRAIKLRAPLTVLGMLTLIGVMAFANVHDVIRYWG